jgi:DNA-binding MarR family transcriptional regulator
VEAPVARDEVDNLLEAWQREKPGLDVSPMEILSRISRLSRHLDRRRAAAFGAHGLEPWEFDVLAALRRSGPPYQLTPGQLLRETLVTSGTMTNRVDRLAARGLVLREDHPGDRRGVLVQLTPSGSDTVDAALADLLAAEQTMVGALAVDDRDRLIAALRTLLAPYSAGEPDRTRPPG